jgi:predicted ATPase
MISSQEVVVVAPIVRTLLVRGFRSFRSVAVEFDNPTFLVGRNGSGKTNLVDALGFLGQAVTYSISDAISWRGGGGALCHGSARLSHSGASQALGLGVVLGELSDEILAARYAFEITFTGADRSSYYLTKEQCVIYGQDGRPIRWFERGLHQPFRSNIAGFEPRPMHEALALPLVGGDERFAPVFQSLAGVRAYSIDPVKLRQSQFPDSGRILQSDGGNTASVLREIGDHSPDDMNRICEILEAVVPAITGVQVKEQGNRLGLEFTQRWNGGTRALRLEGSSMSTGTLRALGLLTAVYQKPTPSLIAIEEPEATIHPGALGVILEVLRHASDRTQLVVTTQSPEVLDADWLEDRHIRIVSWQDGETEVTRLSSGARDALRDHLMSAGELLRANALEGTPHSRDAAPSAELFEDLAP